MSANEILREADRLMTVCNSCRYCEGLCAVFPAMEMRRTFTAGDLTYLANLCHNCGACYHDCQFSPPHEYDVNVPQAFARLRAVSYRHYTWPRALAPIFDRNGLWIAIIAALSLAAFIIGFIAANDPGAVFAVYTGEGAFYRLMPHNAMVAIFGAAFIYAILALGLSLRAFWCDISAPSLQAKNGGLFGQATRDTATLHYLDGGGDGCMNESDHPTDHRRIYHHFTFYGFLLCFAATCIATLYHYVWDLQAPYHWYQLPVVLGTLGGVGLLIGPAGLLAAKWRRVPVIGDDTRFGGNAAFIAMLFLTSLTGLALLLLRATPAMGSLLAIHLGVVFALFVTLPYSKFVHGFFRFAALARYAKERKALTAPEAQ